MFDAAIRVAGRKENAVTLRDAFSRVNLLDWSNDQARWQYVLMNGDRIASGKTARLFASRYIAYLLGDKLSPDEKQGVLTEYRDRHPRESRSNVQLPQQVI
jgi:hypothetical protein